MNKCAAFFPLHCLAIVLLLKTKKILALAIHRNIWLNTTTASLNSPINLYMLFKFSLSFIPTVSFRGWNFTLRIHFSALLLRDRVKRVKNERKICARTIVLCKIEHSLLQNGGNGMRAIDFGKWHASATPYTF